MIITVIVVLYCIIGLATMLMNRRINISIDIKNPLGLAIIFIAWPVYIKNTLPSYRKVIIAEITKNVLDIISKKGDK